MPSEFQATEERELPIKESSLPQETDTTLTSAPLYDQELTTDDEVLELLRTLLFDEHLQQVAQMRSQVGQLQTMLNALEQQIQDEEALINTITPVIAGAIRTNISESREEMIDALYPIMGKLVQRAVTESMRDLAQRIDQRMRRTLDVQALWRRFQARLRGISDAEMTMRDALPMQVDEIFLIHKESGLLLMHLSKAEIHRGENEEGTEGDKGENEDDDSDIISGMLTAISDFIEDALGRSDEEALNEIQYGGRSILLEAAHLVYIAVVIDGFSSSEFRNQMRETMIDIEHRHASVLRNYDGDASQFDESKALLASLVS